VCSVSGTTSCVELLNLNIVRQKIFALHIFCEFYGVRILSIEANFSFCTTLKASGSGIRIRIPNADSDQDTNRMRIGIRNTDI
jgi:hypothetical protein